MAACYVVAVTGGSCAGKSSLLERLRAVFDEQQMAVLAQDSYYKDQSHVPVPQRYNDVNYDHPDAFDMELFAAHLAALRAGQAVRVPIFDYTPCRRLDDTELLQPRPVLLVDGLLLLHDERLCSLFDLVVYVDCPADIRLLRRVQRDGQRGMHLPDILDMYARFVHPMHRQFVECHKDAAHIVIPNVAGTTIAAKPIALLVDHIRSVLTGQHTIKSSL